MLGVRPSRCALAPAVLWHLQPPVHVIAVSPWDRPPADGRRLLLQWTLCAGPWRLTSGRRPSSAGSCATEQCRSALARELCSSNNLLPSRQCFFPQFLAPPPSVPVEIATLQPPGRLCPGLAFFPTSHGCRLHAPFERDAPMQAAVLLPPQVKGGLFRQKSVVVQDAVFSEQQEQHGLGAALAQWQEAGEGAVAAAALDVKAAEQRSLVAVMRWVMWVMWVPWGQGGSGEVGRGEVPVLADGPAEVGFGAFGGAEAGGGDPCMKIKCARLGSESLPARADLGLLASRGFSLVQRRLAGAGSGVGETGSGGLPCHSSRRPSLAGRAEAC